MSEFSDEQITLWGKQIRQSDRKAFDGLFRAMYKPLIRFAIRYTRDSASASDVVQDVFIMLWQKRLTIDPEQSLKAYVYKMVRNRALNYLRSRSRVEINHDYVNDLVNESEVSQQDMDSQTGENMVTHNISSCVQKLPERQRQAFELSRFDGLDHGEIACVMDVSVKTVNNHIVLALRFLRDCVHEIQKNEGRRYG